ncbi:MAG: SufD family Fe-S cluster assembly protein [Candidatus Eisenbacteria sp.]|nr:SufD family Fe-S cluster assembly protein [Candidatus Eisenbacteria bacterium]
MGKDELITALYESLGESCVTAPDVAHVEIHGNEVLGIHLVPGLEIEAQERRDGIEVEIRVLAGARIEQPVRICFGLIPESGVQRIGMQTRLEAGARIAILASCTFPNAIDILHAMNAEIEVGPGAEYLYLERHVHGREGGVRLVPKTKATLAEDARLRTDFELLRGKAGDIDIDYEATCRARSVLEMAARISGRGRDRIRIHEHAHLAGEHARGVLTTSIAVREQAEAEIKNTLIASAAHARGHVDCKEIVQDQAVAHAIPIVEVRHPKAHVTHEAAIGSVDSKQLETLMSRGLDEDQATDLIIEGLLSPAYRGR